jgi:hypothetical protein
MKLRIYNDQPPATALNYYGTILGPKRSEHQKSKIEKAK